MIFNMDELFGFYNFIHFSARIIEIVCLLITKMHFVASKAHYLYEMFEMFNIDRQWNMGTTGNMSINPNTVSSKLAYSVQREVIGSRNERKTKAYYQGLQFRS